MNPWREEIVAILRQEAARAGLDQNFVLAVALTEDELLSPWSCRKEPVNRWVVGVRAYAEKHGITALTEQTLQEMSWGPMHVMGSTARDLGFEGMLTELTTPRLAIRYGIAHLKKQLERYGTETDAVAAYNAGSVRKTPGGHYENQEHVNRFAAHLRELRKIV